MRGTVAAVLSYALVAGPWVATARAAEPSKGVALGRELFLREFRPMDVRCGNGDGLGPVYNAASCVACHSLAGPGGAGSNRSNVDLVVPRSPSALDPSTPKAAQFAEAVRLQSGLPSTGIVLLHKFGTSREFPEWRSWLVNKQYEGFTLSISQRNTPALFGSGLIDSIPDAVLVDLAHKQRAAGGPVSGRVSRTADGRVGKFGWKGQTASLDDFVRAACSAELGLEVPGHHQAADLSAVSPRNAKPAELDLTEAECRALVAFVASLPAPVAKIPARRRDADEFFEGGAVFKTIGCADCHVPTVGEVTGLYSDLLLHDMGPENAGFGYYGSESETPTIPTGKPDIASAVEVKELVGPPRPPLGATGVEWRTPPLWGLRDSGPYMHDGKAHSLADAIARHGGEASTSRGRFQSLGGPDRARLHRFLTSLTVGSASTAPTRTAMRTTSR
jgi:CxxC motif-containing protein (DUF1111 family)